MAHRASGRSLTLEPPGGTLTGMTELVREFVYDGVRESTYRVRVSNDEVASWQPEGVRPDELAWCKTDTQPEGTTITYTVVRKVLDTADVES